MQAKKEFPRLYGPGQQVVCVCMCERGVHARRLVWANCKVLLAISILCCKSTLCLPFNMASCFQCVPGMDAGFV